jgi:hypothetical protein
MWIQPANMVQKLKEKMDDFTVLLPQERQQYQKVQMLILPQDQGW